MLGPILLLALHHGPAHGYTLLEQLGGFGLDGLDPSVVYRALRAMEEQGWVTSVWDGEQTQGPPRRVYSLTAPGDQVLQSWIEDLQETRRSLDSLIEAYNRHMGEYH